jgi:type I restriction enzyme S subunit
MKSEEINSHNNGFSNRLLHLDCIELLSRVPLPPLAEQRRIIAKVNELIDVCDRLESQLIAMQDQKGSLLEALLCSALAGALESDSKTKL